MAFHESVPKTPKFQNVLHGGEQATPFIATVTFGKDAGCFIPILPCHRFSLSNLNKSYALPITAAIAGILDAKYELVFHLPTSSRT